MYSYKQREKAVKLFIDSNFNKRTVCRTSGHLFSNTLRTWYKEYQSIQEAKDGINAYIKKYNRFRPHTSHGIMTPDEVYQITA